MADTERHERTEAPTQKRLDEARERGQVPRSRDLTAAFVLLSAGAALYFMGAPLGGKLAAIMRGSLSLTRTQALDASLLLPAFQDAILKALLATAPVLACTLAAAVAAPMAIGGWTFSGSAMAPKFERMDPIAGIKRMFSINGVVELTKSLVKFLLVALVGTVVVWHNFDALMNLGREPVLSAIGHASHISGQALLSLACALLLIAAVDAPYQVWSHRRELRMTREEVRQEHRESEGSPEVRGRIRNLQRERAQRRMMLDVPKADVIIVNPTHYAIALRYDEQRMRAPIVVAKGTDLIAAKIREIAGENNVPIFEAPPLARAIYRAVEIGGEIPAQLYVAVAQVLTYIFQLRTARRDHQSPPPPPSIDFRETP
jgi:flagellar biosynthetic protein FlhB